MTRRPQASSSVKSQGLSGKAKKALQDSSPSPMPGLATGKAKSPKDLDHPPQPPTHTNAGIPSPEISKGAYPSTTPSSGELRPPKASTSGMRKHPPPNLRPGRSAALPRPAWSSAGVTGRPRCRKDAPEGGGGRRRRVTPEPSPPPLPRPRTPEASTQRRETPGSAGGGGAGRRRGA